MNWLRGIFQRRAKELTYDQIAGLLDGGFGGVEGISVSPRQALEIDTALACVRVIADGCATPPLRVFRDGKEGRRELASNIPEFRLLSRRPNEWQTSLEWRRQMTMHAVLCGTGLSLKVKGDNRRLRELIPIDPGRWDVRKVSRYELRYRVWDEFGQIGDFPADDVFLLNGLQWEWCKALPAVRLAQAALGLSVATEKSVSALHQQALRPSGVYSVEGTLNKEQYERLVQHLREKAKKPHEPMVLDRNAKWVGQSYSGVDSQTNETRRTQVESICRAFGVFPIMVGHGDKTSTFASSEAFFSAHVKHTLAPWHRAWEQRIDEMLLDGSGPLWAQFDTRYLLAGSMKDRAEWARSMVELGVYTRNEVRDEEGKDPLPGLDEPLTPLNMSQGKDGDGDGKTQEEEDVPDSEARARIAQLEARLHAAPQQAPAVVPDEVLRRLEAMDRRMEAVILSGSKSAPFVLDVKAEAFEAGMSNLLDGFAQKLSEVTSGASIVVNVPEQPAPIVNVTTAEPVIHVEAVIQPAPVVINGPKKSEQRVERDPETDEITKTVTTHIY